MDGEFGSTRFPSKHSCDGQMDKLRKVSSCHQLLLNAAAPVGGKPQMPSIIASDGGLMLC